MMMMMITMMIMTAMMINCCDSVGSLLAEIGLPPVIDVRFRRGRKFVVLVVGGRAAS